MEDRRHIYELVGISFASLFLEMAIIRFVNSTVDVIAYFNNFVILSAFLGLGFGSLLVRRAPNLFVAFPALLCAFLGLLVSLDDTGVVHDWTDQVVWVGGRQGEAMSATLAVCLVFFGSLLTFIPLGYKLGETLDKFENKLEAYGYDILGSVLGVLAFTVTSWSGSPPWQWIVAGGIVVAVLLMPKRHWALIQVGLLAGAVYLTTIPEAGIWSPYYKISVRPIASANPEVPLLYRVFVDKQRIQDAMNFDAGIEQTSQAPWVDYYMLPYLLREPERVLIVGGGSGNDAEIALRGGAEHVDVVEIDPVLVQFGSELHPQAPYADPRVNVVADDGRAFLHRTDAKYDLIVMNAVDSHRQLAGLSTLRLESYLYTVDSFRDVQRHMDEDSIFLVHLSSTREWMGHRLYWSLHEAFGRSPTLLTTKDSPYNSVAFVYGPKDALRQTRWFDRARVLSLTMDEHAIPRASTELATDDWPHLYLEGRHVPVIYYYVLGIVVLLSLLGFGALGALKSGAQNLHFMLLGAAFMLLETRAITQFALLFGSTWIVNAIVIGSILSVIWLGNYLLWTGRTAPPKVIYPLLLACLIVLYVVPIDFALHLSTGPRVLAAAVIIGLPVFLASLVFSESFRHVTDTSAAFGSNLVGVVIGGTLEYASMIWGLDFLYLLALGMYVLSWIALTKSRATIPTT